MKLVFIAVICFYLAHAQPADPYQDYSCPCKFEVVDNQPKCGCEDPCRYGPYCQYTYETCECDNPCNPGQVCSGELGDIQCSCSDDCKSGDNCEVDIINCKCADPCVSGSCVDVVGSPGEMICECEDCYEGPYCDQRTISCDCDNDCTDGEVCNPDEAGLPVCGCPECYTGATCETLISSCACDNSCLNPDTCEDYVLDGVALHRCVCDCIGNEICAEVPGQEDPQCICPDCRYNKEGEVGCNSIVYHLCECNNPCDPDLEVCIDGIEPTDEPGCREGNPSSGKEFTVVFEENHTEKSFREIPLELYVTPSVADSGPRSINVRSAGLHTDHPCYFDDDYTVKENDVKRISVERCMMHNKTGVDNLAIKITELNRDTVIVYGINKDRWTADGFLAIPDAMAGKQFQTFSFSPAHIASQFAIVALSDFTEVTMELADDNNLPPPYNKKGSVFTVTLMASQTFQVQARCPGTSRSKTRSCKFDLTGTIISSTQPIHVFSGNVRTFVEGKSRDHLVEELIPTDRWGRQFALISVPEREVGDLVNIMALKGEVTKVELYSETDGDVSKETITLPTAEGKLHMYKQLPSARRHFIVSDKPLFVTQITKSKTSAESYHDPASITVPPVEQFTSNFFISTPLFTGGENFELKPYHTNLAMLVAPKGEENLIQLDRAEIQEFVMPWAPMPSADGTEAYMGAVIKIPSGTHLISSAPYRKFQCLVYGFDDRESYGFPAAMNLKAINNAL